jgi:hypothetical protein
MTEDAKPGIESQSSQSIDDLKRAEEALRESVRESRLIVDSISGWS